MTQDVLAYKVGEQTIDTQTAAATSSTYENAILFDNSKDALELIRHSCAHMMAQAIKALYKDAQFFVGPVIEDGFYYDFRVSEKIGDADLKEIEKKMQEIANSKLPIEKSYTTKSAVVKQFANDDLKQEVLLRIPDGEVSVYKQGDFEDLCRGPHVPNTRYLRFFKLIKVAGAYLGGVVMKNAKCSHAFMVLLLRIKRVLKTMSP